MFRGVLVVDPDRREYGEKRWIGIGSIRGRTAYLIFTEPSPDTIRIISPGKATRREDKQYRFLRKSNTLARAEETDNTAARS
jgi:uncharacterized DUF497 family protein